MSWLKTPAGQASAFDAILGLRPELRDGYREFLGSLWDDELVPPRLLELCRVYIAAIHGCAAEASVAHAAAEVRDDERRALAARELPAGLDPTERAVLQLAAKVPFLVHGIQDAEVARVREALGEPALVALIVALCLFDANCRLKTALEVPAEPRAVDAPASRSGPLY